jgi:hypothetical protein
MLNKTIEKNGITVLDIDLEKRVFDFLANLYAASKDDEVSMLFAGADIEKEFKISRKEADAFLLSWITSL